MRKMICLTFAVLLVGLSSWAQALQESGIGGSSVAFVLIRPPQTRPILLKPGSVLDLHKDGLVMYSIETKVADQYLQRWKAFDGLRRPSSDSRWARCNRA